MTIILNPLLIKPSDAFKMYFKIRGKRSIKRLAQELWQIYGKNVQEGVGRLPHRNTLLLWSKKYNWQEKVRQWDAEKDAKVKDRIIEQVALEDKQILNMRKAGINIFAKRLKGKILKDKFGNIVYDKDGQPIFTYPYISVFEFKALWEIYQVVRVQVSERIAFTKDDEELLTALENVSEKDRKKILKHLAQIDAIKRRYQSITKK